MSEVAAPLPRHRAVWGRIGARAQGIAWLSIGWRDVLGAALTVVGSLLAVGFSMQLWRAHLHIPLAYGSDAMASQMFVKDAVDGWIWKNHASGAPFGQELYDFPIASDSLNFLTIKVIGLFFSGSARDMNVFFIFTFVSDGLAAYVVLRWIGLSIPAAVVCAILFSDSPYHLFRGEAHLLLSSYPSVPMGAYLIVSVLRGRPLFLPGGPTRAGPRWWAAPRVWLTGRNAWIALICVFIGSLGVYYAVFIACVLVAAALAMGLGGRHWGLAVSGVLAALVVTGTWAALDIPAEVYRHQHGTDPLVAARVPAESELYALKLAEMVLPVPGHRVHALNSVRFKYDSTAPVLSENAQQSLGSVATIGLIGLFVAAFLALAGRLRGSPAVRRYRELSFLTTGAFVLGTLGGVSALIGYLITPEIRGWDRISILIMFGAIAAAGLGLDAIRRFLAARISRPAISTVTWPAVLAAVLVLGVIDQSSRQAVPYYQYNASQEGSDAAFVSRLQHMLPHGSMIYQLPYVSFPENGATLGMFDYDEGRGYVNQTGSALRWSYGAMKGRPEDWAAQAVDLPMPELLNGLVGAGFSGIWLDRAGYADQGASVEHQIVAITRQRPITSRNGRMWFFDLRPYAKLLARHSSPGARSSFAQALLRPPQLDWTAGGFYDDESGSRWAQPSAAIGIHDPYGVALRLFFSADVHTLAHRRAAMTVDVPGGGRRQYVIGPKPRRITFYWTQRPGADRLRFTTNAPVVPVANDPRSLAVRYDDISLSDAGFAPLVGASGTQRATLRRAAEASVGGG